MISGVARRSPASRRRGARWAPNQELYGGARLIKVAVSLPPCLRCALPSPNDRVPIKIRPSACPPPSNSRRAPAFFPLFPNWTVNYKPRGTGARLRT